MQPQPEAGVGRLGPSAASPCASLSARDAPLSQGLLGHPSKAATNPVSVPDSTELASSSASVASSVAPASSKLCASSVSPPSPAGHEVGASVPHGGAPAGVPHSNPAHRDRPEAIVSRDDDVARLRPRGESARRAIDERAVAILVARRVVRSVPGDGRNAAGRRIRDRCVRCDVRRALRDAEVDTREPDAEPSAMSKRGGARRPRRPRSRRTFSRRAEPFDLQNRSGRSPAVTVARPWGTESNRAPSESDQMSPDGPYDWYVNVTSPPGAVFLRPRRPWP